jgi:hypothetical protein
LVSISSSTESQRLHRHLPRNASTIAAEKAAEWRGCGEVTRLRSTTTGASCTQVSPSSTSEDQIANEVLRRRATESLIAFTEYTFERYRTAPHHKKIAEAMERPHLILRSRPASAHSYGYRLLPKSELPPSQCHYRYS